jgi:hypothetical protein
VGKTAQRREEVLDGPVIGELGVRFVHDQSVPA